SIVRPLPAASSRSAIWRACCRRQDSRKPTGSSCPITARSRQFWWPPASEDWLMSDSSGRGGKPTTAAVLLTALAVSLCLPVLAQDTVWKTYNEKGTTLYQ